MTEKFTECINNNSYGEKTETILIDGKIYEIRLQWKRRVTINIKPIGDIIKATATSEIKKSPLISLITRYTQYSVYGKRTPVLEKLLSNKYTPALIHYPASKLLCKNNQICFTATIKKKDIAHLEKILKYFEALVITSK